MTLGVMFSVEILNGTGCHLSPCARAVQEWQKPTPFTHTQEMYKATSETVMQRFC